MSISRTPRGSQGTGNADSEKANPVVEALGFRLPFFVPLLLISIVVAAASAGIVAALTFAGANTSVDDILLTLRENALNRTAEGTQGLVNSANAVAIQLASLPQLRSMWDDQLAKNATNWRAYPDVIAILWQICSQHPEVGNVGMQSPLGDIFLATPSGGQVIYQDLTTNSSFSIFPVFYSNPDGTLVIMSHTVYAIGHQGGYPLQPPATTNISIGARAAPIINTGEINYSLEWYIWQNQPYNVAVKGQSPYGGTWSAISVASIEPILQRIVVSPNAVIAMWDSTGAMIASSVSGQVLVPPNFGSQFQATT
ncbi:hypothetical protein BDK51DRAFT_25977, partial [Blyttiomyces helicus]